jgi:hypothetical protein
MEAGRDAAKAFWRAEVQREDRKREPWQLDQWSDAIQWPVYAALRRGKYEGIG